MDTAKFQKLVKEKFPYQASHHGGTGAGGYSALARAAGISKDTTARLSRLEQDDPPPAMIMYETAEKISRVLGVKVTELFDESDFAPRGRKPGSSKKSQ